MLETVHYVVLTITTDINLFAIEEVLSSNFVILRDERTLSSAADIPYEVNIAISE